MKKIPELLILFIFLLLLASCETTPEGLKENSISCKRENIERIFLDTTKMYGLLGKPETTLIFFCNGKPHTWTVDEIQVFVDMENRNKNYMQLFQGKGCIYGGSSLIELHVNSINDFKIITKGCHD